MSSLQMPQFLKMPPFLKMHGAGNDFIILDSRANGRMMTAKLARALGDRHFGVGFDQLAEIYPAHDADFALDFWNNDGTQAGACGNATRCVGDYMLRRLGKDHLSLRTKRGRLLVARQDGQIFVNMGRPQLIWNQIPLARETDAQHLPLAGDPVAVGMGNPHCVFIVPDAQHIDLPALGPVIEHDPLFPEKTNVEYISLLGPDHLRMRVWERGAGITLACGSGACAAAVAAHLRGITARKVRLQLDGGELTADWRDDGVWLGGPVAYVFEGSLRPEWLEGLL